MATSGTNTRQLTENLANYEAQLDQVKAALTNDPDNEELLKLKNDLMEVKQLTLDLLELAPAPKSNPDKSAVIMLYDWKVGDQCKAIWPDNGKRYGAIVEMLAEDGNTCSIKFDGYGTTIIAKLIDLRPLSWEDEGVVSEDKSKKFIAKPNAKQKRAEVREHKKKKALKKKERMNEVEEFREKEKSRWKMFTQRSSKVRSGPISAKQKKSIFAVPDSLTGKVGVGTCNIGGKGMTDFTVRTKNASTKEQT